MGESQYDFQSALKVYYKRGLFPFKPMFDWISYGVPEYMARREWSFTFQDDIYLRFQSYSEVGEWKNSILEKNPIKIDIGPVYSLPPKNRSNYEPTSFQPLERELIFDIDMDEYNSVRTCCTGTNVCPKCWQFMNVAIKIIHRVLTEDFGFKHILWVFSGRRGVHCWVCDQKARSLSAQARASIVEYLTLIGGEGKSKKVSLKMPLHPAVQKAYDIILPIFENHILEEQQLLDDQNYHKILALLPPDISSALDKEWKQKEGTSFRRWKQLVKTVDEQRKKEKGKRGGGGGGGGRFSKCAEYIEIVFQFSYPRLDVAVSKGLNHLLKSPFCIHPKTGRVCVPIDPENCLLFDPTSVPSVADLIDDLNLLKGEEEEEEEEEERGGERKRREGKGREGKEYKGTRLEEHVGYFKREFLGPLLKAIRVQNLELKQQQMMIDF